MCIRDRQRRASCSKDGKKVIHSESHAGAPCVLFLGREKRSNIFVVYNTLVSYFGDWKSDTVAFHRCHGWNDVQTGMLVDFQTGHQHLGFYDDVDWFKWVSDVDKRGEDTGCPRRHTMISMGRFRFMCVRKLILQIVILTSVFNRFWINILVSTIM